MYLFVATHLGSGASLLCDSLGKHIYTTRMDRLFYSHPKNFTPFKEANPYTKIFYDKLTFNFQIASPALYKICKFVYVVREAAPTLNHLINRKGYSIDGAYRYYCYRLRRICEMAKKTPGSLLITWDDIMSERAFESVQKYLGLKKPLESAYNVIEEEYRLEYPYLLASQAQVRFEKHLAYMLPLLQTELDVNGTSPLHTTP